MQEMTPLISFWIQGYLITIGWIHLQHVPVILAHMKFFTHKKNAANKSTP